MRMEFFTKSRFTRVVFAPVGRATQCYMKRPIDSYESWLELWYQLLVATVTDGKLRPTVSAIVPSPNSRLHKLVLLIGLMRMFTQLICTVIQRDTVGQKVGQITTCVNQPLGESLLFRSCDTHHSFEYASMYLMHCAIPCAVWCYELMLTNIKQTTDTAVLCYNMLNLGAWYFSYIVQTSVILTNIRSMMEFQFNCIFTSWYFHTLIGNSQTPLGLTHVGHWGRTLLAATIRLQTSLSLVAFFDTPVPHLPFDSWYMLRLVLASASICWLP